MKETLPLVDRSYLLTDDGIYFAICGNLHSERTVFGMPYYFLTKNLEEIMDIQINEFQIIGGQKYTKLLSQIPRESYVDFIRYNFRDYFYSPPMWEILMKVDRTKVKRFIDPKARVDQLLTIADDRKTDENPLLYTLQQIRRMNPSILSNLGLGGSSLLKDDPLSIENDIDLIFYKRSTVIAARDFSAAIRRLDPRFKGLEEERLTRYLEQKAGHLGGTQESLYHLVSGRWDILFVDGIKLDFSFVDGSVLPPVKSYEGTRSSRTVKIRAKVTGVSDSYFMPTVLDIDNDDFQKVAITKRGYICLFDLNQTIEIVGAEFKSRETGEKLLLVDDFNGGGISPS